MKIRFIDKILPIEGFNFDNSEIKKTKSFVIVKNNLIEYIEKHDSLRENEKPLMVYPFASFKILKLTNDIYKGHKYSSYQIKIDYAGLKDKWYFVDLNWWKYFRLQFNADKSWINKSNIYRLIFLIIGAVLGVIGTIVTQFLTA